MGASLGKNHFSGELSYNMSRRRRTIPNDGGNHFSKQYWEKAAHGTTKQIGSEFWMIESEKQYRQDVFQNKSENVYGKPGSFDSPFSPYTNISPSNKHYTRANSVNGGGRNTALSYSSSNSQISSAQLASSGNHQKLYRQSSIGTNCNSFSNTYHNCGKAVNLPGKIQSNCRINVAGSNYNSPYNAYSNSHRASAIPKYIPSCGF